ncbi:EAL domain-containing protein [Sphingomicrobium sediminis]|uniref:EAL domain-containing protein n=1 Tax=Sphingomicrobium sediminis TaxID=2950949 RepID=A0A9X2EF77_9SPHN|nr:EAL domain-containing protein [Sphingomicrobium sediminis]MCM8556873.1 EAL domain-containing protein [Sphingomicrobium sediminis]
MLSPKQRIGPARTEATQRDPALFEALVERAISIHYQPMIDLGTGRVIAAEALARWDGAGAGADRLFARAREAELDAALSRAIQFEALERAARWTGDLSKIGLSINILPSELLERDFVDIFLERVRGSGFDPSRLTVELVENGSIANHPEAARRLSRLRATGIRIAIDDFGTGYSSLAYLTSLPIDTLKIDRGLVAEIVGGEKDRIVVRALINLARELGLRTVVEGVENAAQLDLLAEWGADLYQGFLGSGPLDEDALGRFVGFANRKS